MDRTNIQGRTGYYGATDYETDYDLYDYIEEDDLSYQAK